MKRVLKVLVNWVAIIFVPLWMPFVFWYCISTVARHEWRKVFKGNIWIWEEE